jgi:hypothetical protein
MDERMKGGYSWMNFIHGYASGDVRRDVGHDNRDVIHDNQVHGIKT